MKRVLKVLLVALMLVPIFNVGANEINLGASAKSVMLIEPTTGEIIYKRNENERLHPASMTKMMSMLLIMENIEKGVIKWDEMVTVSEHASSMGGSQILLEVNEKMSVRDLFKGVSIASGNDAVVALAEKIAGTEEMFVNAMNKRAKDLGLKNTNFKNPHGLDAANHYSSAYDMAMIAKELVSHEEVLKFTSIYEDYLRQNTDKKIWLVNTNKLVKSYDGMDGLKTGYTESAGYCLTATAKRGNLRLLAVVMGEPDSKTRNKEVTEMMDYGFSQYEMEKLLSKDSKIKEVEIDKGKKKYVTVVPTTDVTVLNKKTDGKKNASYELDLNKLKSPIKKGEIIGNLILKENDKVVRKIPVTVLEDVKKANLFELYLRYLSDIISGDIKF